MFGIQGLWTLAKYRVPLVVIVFNNRAYMAVKNQFRGPEERIGLPQRWVRSWWVRR
jgi:thiamine pyrophosphate-dependent acetolactate synthase large subunit-like protein